MPELVTRIYNERKQYKKTIIQKKQVLVDIKEEIKRRGLFLYQLLWIFTVLASAMMFDPLTSFVLATRFVLRRLFFAWVVYVLGTPQTDAHL